MEYIEVEHKFALPDPGHLLARLADVGATAAGQTRQIDTYYNAPHRDFLAAEPVSEWLRVREEGDRASLNYKRWLPLGAVVKSHCDEYETPVADLDALRRLLRAVDFVPLVVVDKVRREWHLTSDVVVAHDTVDGLGSFVEFEFVGAARDVREATDRLAKHIADLGVPLGERLIVGYPHMLLSRRA